MEGTEIIDNKFFDCYSTLSKEEIYELDKEDNGPINNVFSFIEKHCYGAGLIDDKQGLAVRFYFIDNHKGLKGDIIEFDLMDKYYSDLLMRFCIRIADKYEDVDTIVAFNTFQTKLRGFVEKSGFTTVTNLDAEPYLGKDAVMITNSKRGFFKMKLIRHRDYYRNWFGNLHNGKIEENSEYVYLMVNEATGLVKIGRSKNPKYREATLHSKEPTVHVVAFWNAKKELEKLLHNKFIEQRKRGEWFQLNFAHLAELERFVNSELGITNSGG